MFFKQCLAPTAHQVPEGMRLRVVDSWKSKIARYVQKGCWDQVLNSFQQLKSEGVSLSSFISVSILKACRITGSIEKGMEIHAEIARIGLLEENLVVGNALIDIYVKFGLLKMAKEVFDSLPARDIVSWTALIAGFAKHDLGMEALRCFDCLQDDGFHPNAVTYVCTLNACGNIKALQKGIEIHAKIEKDGMLGTNLAVGNALIDMYVKCGLISKAHEVFNSLPNQDVVSWTALIAGYAKHGDGMFALKCLDEMQLKGVAPNAVTYVCCLIACGRIGDVEKGKEIHEEILSKGLLETLALGNALVDMYANCGFLKRALEVFDILPKRDVISWNALMSGYVKYEYGIKALNCLAEMQIEGVNPDFSTLVCGLKACSITRNVGKGREIHAEISRNGFLGRNMVIGSALVDMYGKCGFLEIAHEVFDGLSTPDVISWNSLIAGYAQQEYGERVLECYKKMQANGVPADAVTYVCTLKACGSTQSIDMGEKVHDEVTKQGLLERDPVIGSVLVDMYAKCGLIEKAEAVFDKLLSRDIVSWTSLIAGYTSQERGREALECFSKMELEGVLPNVVTFVCSLKACCSVGAIDKGREVHAELVRKGLMRSNIIVGCAVVDMYAKAGLLMRAQELFHDLPLKDVNAWNVLISGYGKYEHVQDAITCFEQMQFEGIHPDSSTFVHVLNACCHASLVSKGHNYFEAMSRDFGIFPGLEHHTIMAVLCGHSGHLDTVSTIIKRMPINSNFAVWDILLALCRGWGNTRLGKIAFEEVCKSGLVGDAWI